MFVTRNVWMKYQSPTNGEGNDLGGGEGGEGGKEGGEGAGEGDKGGKEGGEGGKKPSDEEARLLKENMKRKEELRKVAEEKATLEAKLKQFEGIDPEAVRKLLADQKTAEEKQLEAKGDYERLKQRMAEEHGKQVSTLQQQIETLQAELGKTKGTINELSIGTQFGQSKFISEELTLTPAKARVIYADYFDLEEGKIVGYDKPRGAANRTALVDQYGNAVAFDEALRKIVEADPEKDHLLKSKMKPGAGSDSKKPSGVPPKETGPVSAVSRIASGLKGLKVS